MTSKRTRARWLALSLLSGNWERKAITDRLQRALPDDFEQLAELSTRLCDRFHSESAPDIDDLTLYLLHEALLAALLASDAIKGPLLDPPVMQEEYARFATQPLPQLANWSDVGEWLSLSASEMAWFADCRSQQANVSEPRLHHYRYFWVPKRTGGFRLIEAPKSRLKAIQRKIVADILNSIPPHDAAHGFSKGRSTKSFVAPHAGQSVVLRLDLQDFFHSVPVARAGALFRQLGYPKNVAWLLQGLCTNAVSASLAGDEFDKLPWDQRKRLQAQHLAQGAPTSAPLANLGSRRLDCRLQGLADKLGLRYTRYADDMAFSGPYELARMSAFIEALVGAIAIDEGFRINHRKTRLRTSSQRQRLAGIVVNRAANPRRTDWDALKAILHNCRKHGPASQNRDEHPNFKAHLRGRLEYMAWLNPARGAKLREIWKQIEWQT